MKAEKAEKAEARQALRDKLRNKTSSPGGVRHKRLRGRATQKKRWDLTKGAGKTFGGTF